MTHLKIELNNIQENVNNIVIEKLYEIASSGDLDVSSNLSGLLHVPAVYRAHTLYLTTMFPLLTIAADDYIIPFEDPAMVTYLNSIGVGSNGMVTEALAAAATIVANSANSTVTKFNELKYFTNIVLSKGGLSGGTSGYVRFYQWTALEEVDISNFVSLGHNTAAAYEDTFRGCTSLKKVIASNKLLDIGYAAFSGCLNLEDIIGLPSEINVYASAFYNCKKLKTENFLNITVNLKHSNGGSFYNCFLLLSLTLSPDITTVYENSFYGCSALQTINLSNVTNVALSAFRGCSALTSVDLSSCTLIGRLAFLNCTSLSSPNLTNCTSIGDDAFNNCTSLTSVDVSSCTNFGGGAFSGCTSLTLVTLNSSISNIPSYMFLNCRALTTVTELGNNTLTVGSYSFLNCESINFPNVITIYPTTGSSSSGSDVAGTFNGCKLNKVVLTGGDLNLGRAFLSNCTTLTEVQGLDKIKYLSGGAFYNNPLLTGTLSFPNCVGSGTRNNGTNTPLNYLMFYNVGATRIELPLWNSTFRDSWGTLSDRMFFNNCPNLTTVLIHVPDDGFPNYRSSYNVRSVLFNECPNFTTLIINNQTVPALKNTSDVVQPIDIGGTGVTLYVPDAIVNDYKTATGWSNIASLIKGMSELPQ